MSACAVDKCGNRTVINLHKLRFSGLDVNETGAGRRVCVAVVHWYTGGLSPGSRRVPIPSRSSIGDYSSEELTELVRWVQADGKLRTHEEISDEMFDALPFARRGSKIEAALKSAIERWERTSGK